MIGVKRALVSVSDKRGLVGLGGCLSEFGVDVLSTGGTAKFLSEADVTVTEVSDFTGFPEMMGGRVKTLHPKIHGGLLSVRGDPVHEADMAANGIQPIDMVVLNLYPFQQTVASAADPDTCIENIDIGGPAMMRSAAKNHRSVAVVTSPDQYDDVIEDLRRNGGSTSMELRRWLASEAFKLSSSYDAAISSWFGATFDEASPTHPRVYTPKLELKYGTNPHQAPAFVGSIGSSPLPFTVLNGSPGYINLLDALNAWQLVKELRDAVGLPAAASFKHVSPAGAAVAAPLSSVLEDAYEVKDSGRLTPTALAYLRARNADPLCSFGDFAAVSEVVDKETAKVLKTEVSDGIIAPGYDDDALEILKGKKGGGFVVLEADPDAALPDLEYREVHGAVLSQRRNDKPVTADSLSTVVTAKKDLSPEAIRDLLVASITIKYTQSNSVGYAVDGQVIGVGAGQQSRVDCVKLAGRKVATWYLRQHPKVLGLKFKAGVKRQARVNARVRYIEGDFSEVEKAAWLELFDDEPEPLTDGDKKEFLATLSGVSLSSDAFFPFRDSIDIASQLGVSNVVQPGGSVGDESVTAACDQYGMVMATSGTRLFHH